MICKLEPKNRAFVSYFFFVCCCCFELFRLVLCVLDAYQFVFVIELRVFGNSCPPREIHTAHICGAWFDFSATVFVSIRVWNACLLRWACKCKKWKRRRRRRKKNSSAQPVEICNRKKSLTANQEAPSLSLSVCFVIFIFSFSLIALRRCLDLVGTLDVSL